MNYKTILEKANTAVSEGDHETFLSYCTDDTRWIFTGDQVLSGKEEVRRYMKEAYREPPRFEVEHMIAEGNFVTAVGTISLLENGEWTDYDYCDVWRFENNLMAELKAFVVKK
ncbi:nuclear transport factor 2 family protein [Chryseobacterium pennipullorum]|uniref:Nuclear transport factor 2 family protein n=1 Tax=Chryseobacterium pennipullorum TaxID=2258963 RepID=A0A3D9B9G8_9FLAO|nr:nuclear transport factor 2 family protein [Chryseobacterium pennipullorum]REC50193.1 nuclear transport factor 2 family protein [Chryseobacterium pennipullorum]